MGVFLFLCGVFCLDELPVLSHGNCSASTDIFNLSEYACRECGGGMIAMGEVCRPPGRPFLNRGNGYASTCSYPYSFSYGGVCLNVAQWSEWMNDGRIPVTFMIRFYDVQQEVRGGYFLHEMQISSEFRKLMTEAFLFHEADPSNRTAENVIANGCAVLSYQDDCDFCAPHQGIGYTGRYGYKYWPLSGLFLHYGSNSLENVLNEEIIKEDFKNGQDVVFYLGRFSKNGEWLGFTRMNLEFQKCGELKSVGKKWQKYGFNFHSECLINLWELRRVETTDFFEPFIADGQDSQSNPVLRPVPVWIKNYRSQGIDVNRRDSPRAYRAFRRFFVFDNWTNDDIVQVITNFSVLFRRRRDGTLQPPLFQIEYTQIRNRDIVINEGIVRPKQESMTYHPFDFEIVYTQDISGFWNAVTIVVGVFAALTIVYLLARIIGQAMVHGQDGLTCTAALIGFGLLFAIVGAAILWLIFCLSLYIFIGFKAGKVYLPETEEEFDRILVPMLWSSFALQFFGAFLLLMTHSGFDFFVIDLDDEPAGFWRRLTLAAQWARLSTYRVCNVAFLLFLTVTILEGLDVILLSTKIPSFELLDLRNDSLILRFSVISVIWVLIVLVQYLYGRFVHIRLWGDPFLGLIDMCKKLRVSAFIQLSSFYGYFVQSRGDPISDEDLSEEVREKEPDVFATFFAPDLRAEFAVVFSSLMAEVGDASLLAVHGPGDGKFAGEAVYSKMNTLLRDFFDEQSFSFVVQPEPLMQKLLEIPPTVLKTSVFTPAVPSRLKEAGLGRSEWSFLWLYLSLFICLDSVTRSPVIGAVVVYVLDVIVMRVYKLFVRANLARKNLLDDRLYI